MTLCITYYLIILDERFIVKEEDICVDFDDYYLDCN